MRVVRAFDKEQAEVNRFEEANALLTKMQLRVGRISALMNPLTYVDSQPGHRGDAVCGQRCR